MFCFIDENGYNVELEFGEVPTKIPPKHVLVIVHDEQKWLCTINQKRGVEFPGGKVEHGETLQQAAMREVYEETAVHITNLQRVAHYTVFDKNPFCKVVYTAKVEKMDPFIAQYETSGVVWLTTEQLINHPNLSFYMKDEGMKKIIQEVLYHERKR